VDAIYLQSEAALPVGSLLTRDFGLLGPSVESVHLCSNKYLSRERLSQCGISTPQFVLGENTTDVYRAAGKFGYPLVLKGVSSAHSRLVTLVHSGKDVEPAVQYLQAGLVNSQEIARLSSFASVLKEMLWRATV
jgi:biotin carboxylase